MSDLKQDLASLRLEREPESHRSRRWLGWALLAAFVLAGGAGALWWFSRERPVEVSTITVSVRQAGAQAAVLNATGYVTARRRATVSSKITGKVVQINVEEGMAIRQGQVLARLDDETQRAAVALAEAQAEAARRNVSESEVRLNEARITLERVSKLVKVGYSTTAEVDAARAAVDSLDARIRAAREQVRVAERQIALEQTNLDSTIIRAPFDGVAISKDAQPGEMVSPVSAGGGFTRTGICTIVDMRSLEIEVDVNESYINRVRPDQGVTAVLDAYPDWQIPAKVITTVPAADRQKATVLVRIAFNELDPRILPDMGVKVTFLRENPGAEGSAKAAEDGAPAARPVALVPKAAIRTEGKQSYAFVVVNDLVDRRAVTIGGTDGDRLEVLAGLNAGERVVVSPPADLTSGVKVASQ
jgi:RND family efflux transporter MFP subunit